MKSARSMLVDPNDPRSLSARARARRWDRFSSAFPTLNEMRVLDLGGTPDYWRSAPMQPAAVTIVNLETEPATEPWITLVTGDACSFAETGFDLVVSNSLLEHLGGPERRRVFADTVLGAAPRHWVQTPYRYFPVEPHWLFPGFQFLPLSARVAVTRHWRYGHRHEPDRDMAMNLVLEVELVTATEMRHLFPGAELWFERLGGLVKSLVSIR